jgi:membrane-bound lytic murein transglycosylase D
MLKTSFVKAFYLCNSFLLITVPFTINPTPSLKVSLPKEKNGLKTSLLGTRDGTIGKIHADHEFNLTNRSAQFASNKPQITLNTKGMLFVRKYIKNSGECLVSVKKRSLIPFYIIDSVFNRYGLPVELKYLAVIESELKPSALSQVGARGPWQIMPATAHILGLKITRQCDERTNYYKSTIAAARYLKDLYAQFDDWLLVLAAYNGGPKPVYTAIRESGSKNFWVLQDYLPSESREHVKKFIATHYYFEGRGSETTLTRAENIEYKRTVNAFVKSHYTPAISEKLKIKSNNTYKTRKYLAINYDMMQLIGVETYEMNNNFQKNKTIDRQTESSEQKFKRLMKESEESLKRSVKII